MLALQLLCFISGLVRGRLRSEPVPLGFSDGIQHADLRSSGITGFSGGLASLAYSSKLESVRFSETSVSFYQTTWRQLPEDGTVYSVACMSDCRRGFWKIGFIDHLHAVTTNNYNIIADFHNLQSFL
jgi:hypothetical protein